MKKFNNDSTAGPIAPIAADTPVKVLRRGPLCRSRSGKRVSGQIENIRRATNNGDSLDADYLRYKGSSGHPVFLFDFNSLPADSLLGYKNFMDGYASGVVSHTYGYLSDSNIIFTAPVHCPRGLRGKAYEFSYAFLLHPTTVPALDRQ